MALVNVQMLFKNTYSFPWEFMDLHRPVVGTVHSYICQAMARYADDEWKAFLKGRPTMFELRRAAVDNGLIKEIVSYCDGCADERGGVGEKVLRYLNRIEPLKAELQSIMDRKLRDGIIHVPKEFLHQLGKEWLREHGA